MKFHGILACGGEGSRFAESVGKNYPYPKHLEKINGVSILELAFKSMVNVFDCKGVTFTLNPYLEDKYIDQLGRLQGKYGNVELSYCTELSSHSTPFGNFPASHILSSVATGEVYRVNGGQKVINDKDYVVLGCGDAFILPQHKSKINEEGKITSSVEKALGEGKGVLLQTETTFEFLLGKWASLKNSACEFKSIESCFNLQSIDTTADLTRVTDIINESYGRNGEYR